MRVVLMLVLQVYTWRNKAARKLAELGESLSLLDD